MSLDFYKIIVGLVIPIMVSCGGYGPKPEFDKTFKRKNINLSNKIGESFSVITSFDTISYYVSFDKSKKLNLILDQYGDTVLVGTVSKLGNMYLVNKGSIDGHFRITALIITDSTITGFKHEDEQLRLIKQFVRSGKYASLILDTTERFILTPNKRDGKKLYKAVLSSFPFDRLLVDPEIVRLAEKTVDDSLNSELPLGKTIPILKVYPNPVKDILTVETMNSMITYDYVVSDASGRIFRSGILAENGTTIDFTDLDAGAYFLIVPETGQSIKIVNTNY